MLLAIDWESIMSLCRERSRLLLIWLNCSNEENWANWAANSWLSRGFRGSCWLIWVMSNLRKSSCPITCGEVLPEGMLPVLLPMAVIILFLLRILVSTRYFK